MKRLVAILSACVFTISGCAVTARVPQSQPVTNRSDIRQLEEFDREAERILEKREKIDRLLKKIRGNGS